MNKRLAIIITLIIILIGLGIGTYILRNNLDGEQNIELNNKIDIKTLKSYQIGSSNDTFKITTELSPEQYSEGTTTSFSQYITYEFIVNGSTYNGKFIFDSSNGISSDKDGNPKYDVDIINYSKKNGTVTVIISNKLNINILKNVKYIKLNFDNKSLELDSELAQLILKVDKSDITIENPKKGEISATGEQPFGFMLYSENNTYLGAVNYYISSEKVKLHINQNDSSYLINNSLVLNYIKKNIEKIQGNN